MGCCQVKNKFLLRDCNLPRAREKPLLGSVRLMQPHEAMLKDHEEYGKTFLGSRLTEPLVFTSDPDLIRHVLVEKNFPKGSLHRIVGDFFGHSLVSLQHGENQPWAHHRRLIDPAFRSNSLSRMSTVFAKHASAFVDAMTQTYIPTSVNFATEIDKLTLGIIADAGFSYDAGTLEVGTENPFLSALQAILAAVCSPLMILPFGVQIQRLTCHKSFELVDQVLFDVIDRRSGGHGPTRDGNLPDILDLMLRPDAEGIQLTKEELRNELLIFFVAGHETTASVLNWTLFELLRNPAVMDIVMDEITGVMGSSMEPPTREQVTNMRYLDMVFNEILRLYPPAMFIQREIDKTFTYDDLTFPKGLGILCSSFVAQRDPDVWQDPEHFYPGRFDQAAADRPVGSFLPFSLGQRVCIGRNFFFLEAKIILVTLLTRLSISLDPHKISGEMVSTTGMLKIGSLWLQVTPKK